MTKKQNFLIMATAFVNFITFSACGSHSTSSGTAAATQASVTEKSFSFLEAVNSEIGKSGVVDKKYVDAVNAHQILFVNGVTGGAALTSEYTQYLASDFNFKSQNFVSFQPSFLKTAQSDADVVYQQILNLRAKQTTPQPILVWAHSMGSLDVFLALTQHPELVSLGIVDHVVMMEGPIHGTPYAEILLALKNANTSTSFWSQPLAWFQKEFAVGIFQLGIFKSLQSLSMTQTEPVVQQAVAGLTTAQKTQLTNALVFITVAQPSTGAVYPWMSQKLFQLAQTEYPFVMAQSQFKSYPDAQTYVRTFGASDDIIPLMMQSYTGLGQTWGPLPGSHMTWLTSKYSALSPGKPEQIHAFVRALMKSVFP